MLRALLVFVLCVYPHATHSMLGHTYKRLAKVVYARLCTTVRQEIPAEINKLRDEINLEQDLLDEQSKKIAQLVEQNKKLDAKYSQLQIRFCGLSFIVLTNTIITLLAYGPPLSLFA